MLVEVGYDITTEKVKPENTSSLAISSTTENQIAQVVELRLLSSNAKFDC